MGVARGLAFGVLLFASAALAMEAQVFRRPVAEAVVDWSAGTITAQGGAAADPRMPNTNAARPGAERRARAAALEKLRAAAGELLRGRQLDGSAVLERAIVSRTEYQSNGGVVLWLTLRFSDLVPAPPAKACLRVATMPFVLAPTVAFGGKSATLGFATYRPASEAPRDAVAIRRDGEGRLVLSGGDARLVDSLAGVAVVIYLEKPQP